MLLSKASRVFEEKTRTLYLYYQCLCFLYELHRYKIPDGAHLKPPRPSLQKTFQTCANQSSLRLERHLITSQKDTFTLSLFVPQTFLFEDNSFSVFNFNTYLRITVQIHV